MLLYSIYRNTVSAVIYITSCNFVHISCILYRIERLPVGGGRGRIFNAEQEAVVVNMVLANNAIRLREIKAAVIADQGVFRNIHTVSEATIDRVLRRNHMAMKQLYRVPFQRNSEAVKEARCQYVEVRKHNSTILVILVISCSYCRVNWSHFDIIVILPLYYLANNGA